MPKTYLLSADRVAAEEERKLNKLAGDIRAEMARKKIEKCELAEKVGVSRTALWDYLDNGGLKKAQFGVVLKILNAVGMTADDLRKEGVIR